MQVALAEDNLLLREGVARLLTEAGFDVAAQCGTAAELLAAVDGAPPDVAIVDIRMPPTHTDEGLRAAQRDPRASIPDAASSCSPSTSRWRYALSCCRTPPRASATCSRTASPTSTTFADAVRRVAGGGSALDPEVVAAAARPPRAPTRWTR